MLKPIVLTFLGDDKQLEAVFNKLEVKAGKAQGAFSKMAGLGGAALKAVGAGAVAAGVYGIKMADDWEKAHAKLESSLENTGSSFGKVRTQVDKLVSSGQNFGHSRTDVEEALATMTTGLGDAHKAMSAFGVVEDLAAKTGKPLNESALLVTKAMQGQTKPLKALGIDLPVAAGGAAKTGAAMKKLAAANDALSLVQDKVHKGLLKGPAAHYALQAAMKKVAAAQSSLNTVQGTGDTILAALGKRLSGQAAKQADTFGGKLRSMHAMIQNLGIKIGQFLIPWIMRLVTWIQDAGKWLGKHRAILFAVVTVLGLFVAALIACKIIETVKRMTEAWTVAQEALNVALDSNPIGLIVIGIAALVAGIIWAYTNIKGFREVVDSVFHFVANLVSTVVNFIGDHWKLLLAILTGPIGLAVFFIVGHFNEIVNFVAGIPGKVVSFFSSIPSRILGLAAFFLNVGVTLGEKILHGITSGISGAVGAIGDIAGAAWDAFKGFLNRDLIDPANSFLSKISVLGYHPFGAHTFPRLANGAIVTGPTMAMIGEAGAEAVVPLTRPSRAAEIMKQAGLVPAGGGKGGLHVGAIYVTANDPRAAAREMGQELAWAAKTSGY